MARRRIPETTGRHLEELLGKSDEEIGRWIDSHGKPDPHENDLLRVLIRGRLKDEYLDKTVRNASYPLLDLAMSLAFAGDFARAGRAFRTHSLTAASRFNRQKLADLEMRITKLQSQGEKHERWRSTGLKIREAERGKPMSNIDLARRISAKTRDPIDSIRVELPRLGLAQSAWLGRFQDRVKADKAKALPEKRKQFGSLRGRS